MSSSQKTDDTKEEKEVVYPQTTRTVLMIPPNKYAGWNAEAAKDNKFMQKHEKNLKQYEDAFNRLVDALNESGVEVILTSKGDKITPDSIFPNNWLSLHDGVACIYPMRVPNRRKEVRQDIIDLLKSNKYGLVSDVYDMSGYVDEEKYFEGTGALVLDRGNRIAYCNLSLRSYAQLAVQWANYFGYKLVLFEAFDDNGDAIYHTNVIMSVGTTYAIVCFDSIKGERSKKYVKEVLQKESKKDIIEISIDQVKQFCGNVLEVQSKDGTKILAMSDKAYKAFTNEQVYTLEKQYGLRILHPNIDPIEKVFGGGVRCMIAEVF